MSLCTERNKSSKMGGKWRVEIIVSENHIKRVNPESYEEKNITMTQTINWHQLFNINT